MRHHGTVSNRIPPPAGPSRQDPASGADGKPPQDDPGPGSVGPGTRARAADGPLGSDPEDWAAGGVSDRDDWLRRERPPHW